MKLRPKALFLMLAVTAGSALSAPPVTISHETLLKLAKIDPTKGLTFACPVVSATAAMGVTPPWTQKNFSKSGLTAQSAYTKPGVAHDSCWCVYKATSDHVPGSETNFLLEREAVPGAPVCSVDANTKSFTCFPLKSGEFY